MTTIEQAPVDAGKLEQFVFRAVDEVGATLNAALVVMGDRLGLYRALAGAGALTPAELAARTGTAERYVREWLNAQAAGGYVDYHPSEDATACRPSRRSRSPTRTARPTCRGSSRSRSARCSTRRGSPRPPAPAPASAGTSTTTHVHDGCERFFRPGLQRQPVDVWLPALDGVVEQLERGARVADVGCGHGASTILMAARVSRTRRSSAPTTTPGSIETARRAGRAGRRGRPRPLRGRARRRLQRRGLRPRDDVRLPARHGRPRRRGPARAATRSPPTARG